MPVQQSEDFRVHAHAVVAYMRNAAQNGGRLMSWAWSSPRSVGSQGHPGTHIQRDIKVIGWVCVCVLIFKHRAGLTG